MAITVVRTKQTGAASASLAITIPTAKNTLLMFVMQEATTSAPSLTGFTFSGTSALQGGSVNSLWVGTKEATGFETTLAPTAGAGGTVIGISYGEVSGASLEFETVVATSNSATSTSQVSGAVTTANAGDAIFGAVCFMVSNGSSGNWTGTGPMTRVEEAATRCMGGFYVPGTTLSAATFTANWTTSRPHGMLVVALKPASGSKTVEEASTTRSGASSSALSRLLATAAAAIRSGSRPSASAVMVATAGPTTSTGSRSASAAAKLVSASASTATGARTAINALKIAQSTALASTGARTLASATRLVQTPATSSTGARAQAQAKLLATGSATSLTGATCRATISGQKTVEEASLSRSGARPSAQAIKLAIGVSASRTGARASIAAKLIVASPSTTRTGTRSLSAAKLVAVGLSLTRTGAISFVETPATAITPGRIAIRSIPAAIIAIDGQPAAQISVTSHPAARITISSEV